MIARPLATSPHPGHTPERSLGHPVEQTTCGENSGADASGSVSGGWRSQEIEKWADAEDSSDVITQGCVMSMNRSVSPE